MNSMMLCLTNEQGDELTSLLLDQVQLAPPETESGEAPAEQMKVVYGQIVERLGAEQVECLLDPIDFGITVSRALLAGSTEESVRIVLPVRPFAGRPTLIEGLDIDFDALFTTAEGA